MSNSMHDRQTPDLSIDTHAGAGARNRPSWSDPALDQIDRGGLNQPEDDGVVIGRLIDEWVVQEPWGTGDGMQERRCAVHLYGFRHDAAPDWADYVHVDLATDGCEGDALQNPADIRRLAAALVKAAELLEGEAR